MTVAVERMTRARRWKMPIRHHRMILTAEEISVYISVQDLTIFLEIAVNGLTIDAFSFPI